uniref:Reverse transcriptase domain-containing protein n=1 Tax=Monopterus albus TaxID=43700 RepID=A0A3Q3K0J1_MONAL
YNFLPSPDCISGAQPQSSLGSSVPLSPRLFSPDSSVWPDGLPLLLKYSNCNICFCPFFKIKLLFPVNKGMSVSDYSNFPFRTVGDKFTYLGITVTRRHKNLFKENVLTLLDHTKHSLAQWSPLSTSLIGRIHSIKMNVLPKFLYIFQSVPTFIPKLYFDTLDSIISSYIWKGKRPRLSKVHLQKSKAEGGMALPNFRLYYWAATIRCLTFWSYFHSRSDRPPWVAMELGSAKNSFIPIIQW